MPIQLDKILENMVKERILHPHNVTSAAKSDVEEAWNRVGRNNKLSVHEARSIFKVLQKKYEQEKVKENSSWKLFGLMQIIHGPSERKSAPQTAKKENKESTEEIEEYEMLDVHETEEDDAELTEEGQGTDSDSLSKSVHNSTGSPEKEDKIVMKGIPLNKIRPEMLQQNDEKKVLNIGARPVAGTTILQKKPSITIKKTPIHSAIKKPATSVIEGSVLKSSQQNNKIRLPEFIKRKLNEDLVGSQNKKATLSEKIGTIATTTTSAQLSQLKKERETGVYTPPPGINIITVPANGSVSGCVGGDATSSTGAGSVGSSTSANGFSTNVNDINFTNGGIIFDSSDINGSTTVVSRTGKIKSSDSGISSEFINLANFDNSLPPTFFKNLCNSTRHEALGLYVSNIMNRLAPRGASKLEISILRAILDAQSEELED